MSKPKQEAKVTYTKLFINNEFVPAVDGREFETVNPVTGEVICKVSEASAADVDRAVKAARAAFEDSSPKSWRGRGPSGRAALMNKFADLVEKNAKELAALEALDSGKTVGMALASDVAGVAAGLRYFAGWATKINGKTLTVDGPYTAYTIHEPIGVVGAIIPWNFPLLMATWKMSPCLAAGNTLVIKSSEKTPLSLLRLASLAKEAGFPPGVFNAISGFGQNAGAALASHMDVDKIAFTGSTATGRAIMRAAANSNLKRVSLELGGKSPNIIFPDFDLDQAVEGAHRAMFLNAGQMCSAGSRAFVHESVYDQFVKKSVERAKKVVFSKDDPANFLAQGPQVDDIQHKRVLEYIRKGQEEGATLAYGGQPVSGKGYYVQPTIFSNVTDDMVIAREEIFGPVLCVLKFKDVAEVAARANATTYGLAAAVWTKDIGVAHAMAASLKAGTVWVNCYNVMQPNLPFGGYKESGFGRDASEYALHEYTQVKTVTIAHPPTAAALKSKL